MDSPTVQPATLDARRRSESVRLFVAGMPRFLMGAAGAIVAGWFGFRSLVFDVDQPAFQCLTVGLLASAILTLVRLSRRGAALALIPAFAGIRAAADGFDGLVALLLGLGIFLVALIFDELARYGLRLGKFLLVGPLLGGVYLVLAPLAGHPALVTFSVLRPLLLELYLGIVIGNGVGLGIEVAELLIDDDAAG